MVCNCSDCEQCNFLQTYISQDSVATSQRCVVVFNDGFIANFSPSVSVYLKSVNIFFVSFIDLRFTRVGYQYATSAELQHRMEDIVCIYSAGNF